jgi:hypothetical protein
VTSQFTSKGQALIESVAAFGVLIVVISSSGSLFYDQFKKVNRERMAFEKSHREMIQRRTIHEGLRFE